MRKKMKEKEGKKQKQKKKKKKMNETIKKPKKSLRVNLYLTKLKY
jgi:hypothetical protein